MQAMLDFDDHHWWYRGRRKIIRSELDRLALPSDAKVLDAGCGSGRTLTELAPYGEVFGIELDPDAAKVARGRNAGEVRIGRLEELPWDADTFDLITCLDVIEHTADDRVTLSELRRVSRPGAWLLVTVPAYQALWSQHDDFNHHFRRYGRRTLRAAALDSGWRVHRVTSFNSLLFGPAAAVRIACTGGDEYSPPFQAGSVRMASITIFRIIRFRPAICAGTQASGTRPSTNSGKRSPQIHACMQPIEVPITSRR